MDKLEFFVFIDAAFAINTDHTSQIWFLALIHSKEAGAGHIRYCAIQKSKRVFRSVLAPELFALVEGFDLSFAIKDTLQRATGRQDIPFKLATDSQLLFRFTINLAQTTEKSLLVDLAVIPEEYERWDLTHFVWIPGALDSADDLSKEIKLNGM